jgi:hypothetical protein
LVVEPPSASEAAIKELSQILAGVHAVMAIGLASPEILLSDEEAARLGASVANVARYYAPMDLTGKKGALLGLAACCVTIYGPKAFAVAMRKARARQPAPHPTRAEPAEPLQETMQ